MTSTEERLATWRRIRERVAAIEPRHDPAEFLGQIHAEAKVMEIVADELGIEARGHVVELVPERDAPKRVET
jgi:hypothetical protein